VIRSRGRAAGSPAPSTVESQPGSDVVVGVDGSEASRQALRWAVAVATARSWSVEVVTAWPHDAPVFLHDVPGHHSDARERARLTQQQAVDEVLGEAAAEVRLRTTLENARPERLLAERAHDSRLLVLGAVGTQGLAERCRKLGTCPVAVVGPGSREPEVLPPLLSPARG